MLQSARAASYNAVGPWMTNESTMLQVAQSTAQKTVTIVVDEIQDV